MKKFFLCLCLSFGGSSFAELSDDKKRAFIESLAEPSSEDRVFYTWQSEEEKRDLLAAGEMTPDLYEYYVGREPETQAQRLVGRGLYVAEDISSSSRFGEAVIKVIVEKGYPFIDLEDEKMKRQLQKKGISLEEAYRLKPRVAVKDLGPQKWWCLKRREGVRFASVSNEQLMESFKKAHLSIRGDGKSRIYSLLSQRERKRLIDGIENIFDGLDILFVAGRSLSELEKRKIVDAIVPHITDADIGALCLSIGWTSLSKKDKDKIMDKTLSHINTEKEMEALYTDLKKSLIYKEVVTEFQAALQKKAEQVKGIGAASFADSLSEEQLDAISKGRSGKAEQALERVQVRPDGTQSVGASFVDSLSEEQLDAISRGRSGKAEQALERVRVRPDGSQSGEASFADSLSEEQLDAISRGRSGKAEQALERVRVRSDGTQSGGASFVDFLSEEQLDAISRGRSGKAEQALERVRVRPDGTQNRLKKPDEKKLEEAVQKFLSSGDMGHIQIVLHEYVRESLCSQALKHLDF